MYSINALIGMTDVVYSNWPLNLIIPSSHEHAVEPLRFQNINPLTKEYPGSEQCMYVQAF